MLSCFRPRASRRGYRGCASPTASTSMKPQSIRSAYDLCFIAKKMRVVVVGLFLTDYFGCAPSGICSRPVIFCFITNTNQLVFCIFDLSTHAPIGARASASQRGEGHPDHEISHARGSDKPHGTQSNVLILGVISSIEMGLIATRVPFKLGGVENAMKYLAEAINSEN